MPLVGGSVNSVFEREAQQGLLSYWGKLFVGRATNATASQRFDDGLQPFCKRMSICYGSAPLTTQHSE